MMQPQTIEVPIKQVVPSKKNPRRSMEGVSELVESIKAKGILTPLLVRREDNHLDLIAGHRRLEAARAAGIELIPVRVLDVSSDEAEELRIIDNAQRVDVHPLEEAEAYAHLAKKIQLTHPDSLGEIARRVGKTRAHVAQRIVLVQLPKTAQAAFRERKIDHEVALLIARVVDPDTQAAVCKEALTPIRGWSADTMPQLPNAAALRKWIQTKALLKLKGAPFDRTDAELVPGAGACGPCPKRSGNDKDLFGDVTGDDLCTDPGCFRRKLDADFGRRAAIAKKAGLEVLPAAATKKIFSGYDGNIGHQAGYVDPKAREWKAGKEMQLRNYLGKHAPERSVLVQDAHGFPRELWHEKDVEAAKAKLSRSPVTGDGSADKYREQQRENMKKAKLRKAAKYVAMDKAVIATQLPGDEADFLRLMIAIAMDGDAYDSDGILAAFPQAKGKAFDAWFKKASIPELRTVLLIETVGCIKTNWTAERNVEVLVKHCGMDWAKLEKEAVALAEKRKLEEREAKKAAPPAKAKKKRKL